MATSVLEVRGAGVPPRAPAAVPPGGPAPAALRRVPVAVLVAGLLAVLQSVGLLAVALTGLDGVLAAPSPSAARVLAVGLLALAGWIVLAAGTGAALVDATGRRGFVGLAWAETGLAAVLAVLAATTTSAVAGPAVVLLAGSVPVAKLLLAGTPAARRWAAQGPRVRERRPDPVAAHRLLATLTLGAIGAGLVALTVLVPVEPEGALPDGTVSSAVDRP